MLAGRKQAVGPQLKQRRPARRVLKSPFHKSSRVGNGTQPRGLPRRPLQPGHGPVPCTGKQQQAGDAAGRLTASDRHFGGALSNRPSVMRREQSGQ